jgi:carboxylate-amine ligase
LRNAPAALMEACQSELTDQVSPEFLRCQIEVGTPVSANIDEARVHLSRLRSTIARHSAEFGLAPISAACHPFADWRDQDHTDKERYKRLSDAMRVMARRMLICGMHVHVGIEDKAQRIDLMNQFKYFLPRLLALSASSPFWMGQDTGLASYRTTVFSGYPRSGLPPELSDWGEFERCAGALVNLDIIKDSSEIWWDLRPSARFPTLETRICDACSRLSETITMAAVIQATLRMLWRLSQSNMRWRQYDNFLIGENRWRASRYGLTRGLIDFGAETIKTHKEIAEDWLALIGEDADHLGSQPSVARLRDIAAKGNSADRQRAVFAAAIAAGASHDEAHRIVVMQLIKEFHEDLE